MKKPWPTKDAMEQIYKMKLWGDNQAEFYSGDGSHDPYIINPYITAVRTFLSSFKREIAVCDLGCGDFNVGKELVKYTKNYVAVDIVPGLIRHNKENFKAENLEFHCIDIAKEELPKADCVILRQVLQHLSNFEIQQIVNKLSNYKYIILTEHTPKGEFIPNSDIISGQGIRLKKQSGVNLLAQPFNLKVKEAKLLLPINLANRKGVITTWQYKMY